MKVQSTIYPELWLHDVKIRFHNGVAEITDLPTLKKLQAMDAKYGIALTAPIEDPKPKKAANKKPSGGDPIADTGDQ